MNVLTYFPRSPLSDFVELLWLSHGPVPAHRQERLLPMGTTELVINLQDDNPRIRCGVVAGPRSKFLVIDTADQAGLLGVHFRPGGASFFFAPPAGELQNAQVSLDALWGRRADELRECVLEAPSPGAKFRLLEQFLLSQAVRPLVRHPAVAFALEKFRDSESRRIADVTSRIGLSQRRFIQLFEDEVGLTPKLFCRVERFQQMVRLVGKQARADWAALAQTCGYYDQAHFIHDFQAFSGLSPSAYLLQKSEHLNHVPVLG